MKIINIMMLDGKKSLSEKIVYKALDKASAVIKNKEPISKIVYIWIIFTIQLDTGTETNDDSTTFHLGRNCSYPWYYCHCDYV